MKLFNELDDKWYFILFAIQACQNGLLRARIKPRLLDYSFFTGIGKNLLFFKQMGELQV